MKVPHVARVRGLAAFVVSLLGLGAFPSCTAAQRAERARCDQCSLTLPVLHGEPPWPYRVISVVEGADETELAWYACAEKADAVISVFTDQQDTTIIVGGPNVATGHVRTKHRTKFVGRAIKYDRQPMPGPPFAPPPPSQPQLVPGSAS